MLLSRYLTFRWLAGYLDRSVTETKKKYEEKHAKAEELRKKVMKERAVRVKLLTSKVCTPHSLSPFAHFRSCQKHLLFAPQKLLVFTVHVVFS